MRNGKSRIIFITSILLLFFAALNCTEDSSPTPNSPSTPDIREPSLPIDIIWTLLEKPVVGRSTRFQLEVESGLDPDLVREVRMEYDLPPGWRRPAALEEDRAPINKSGRNRRVLGLIIPDEARYAIRARVILTLRNGEQISQTAVQWVDLGAEDPPPGMTGRIENPDGSGIRVYQGVSVGGGND